MNSFTRERAAITILFITIAIAGYLLSGCAGFTKDAYRSLAVSQQTYDTALSVMGDLYKEGKVTVEQKDKAIQLGRAYKTAHNTAISALAFYEEVGTDQSKQAYLTAATNAARLLSELMGYVQPLIEKGGK